MQHISYSRAFIYDGIPWFINSKKSGIRTPIMKRILEQYHAMLDRYSRVFVTRFDLSTHQYHADNSLISALIQKINQYLISNYKINLSGYIWVRETNTAKTPHYHVALFLPGRKICYPSSLNSWIMETWKSVLQAGRCYIPENCFSMTSRSDIQTQSDIIYRLSYLAKGAAKDKKPQHTRIFSCSRLKRISKRVHKSVPLPSYVENRPGERNRILGISNA